MAALPRRAWTVLKGTIVAYEAVRSENTIRLLTRGVHPLWIRLRCALAVRRLNRFRPPLWWFAYLAGRRRVLSLVVLVLRRRESKETEILVLRHDLEILRRRRGPASSRPIGPFSPR